MIYKLDSGDIEHDIVGEQWVVIYGHVISSSNMKKGWLQWRCVVFTSSMKNDCLRKVVITSSMKKGWLRNEAFTSSMKKGWLHKTVLVQHEKGLALRFSSSMKKG